MIQENQLKILLSTGFDRLGATSRRFHFHLISPEDFFGNQQVHRLIIYHKGFYVPTNHMFFLKSILSSVSTRIQKADKCITVKWLAKYSYFASGRQSKVITCHQNNLNFLFFYFFKIGRIFPVFLFTDDQMRQWLRCCQFFKFIHTGNPMQGNIKATAQMRDHFVVIFPHSGNFKFFSSQKTADTQIQAVFDHHDRCFIGNLLRNTDGYHSAPIHSAFHLHKAFHCCDHAVYDGKPQSKSPGPPAFTAFRLVKFICDFRKILFFNPDTGIAHPDTQIYTIRFVHCIDSDIDTAFFGIFNGIINQMF